MALALTTADRASANGLPLLGDYSSSIISLNSEYNLGQGIIRQIRNSNQPINDPMVDSYLQDLTWDLVAKSQLQDKRISLAVIGNKSVNAFAAPGGVIGIHVGLIIAAGAEDELASVISHELAHLSQRHFASQLERNRINSPFAIASLITGVLIAAANPEAGTAVLSTSMASSMSASLAFSRKNEQEADRIGMQNLSQAGYDPSAMPRMFGKLLELQRLQGSIPPEFLLTHPSSSSRIADSKNRALQLKVKSKRKPNLDFSIIKARLKVKYHLTPSQSLSHYRTTAKKNRSAINLYSLAMAEARSSRFKDSINSLQKLPAAWRDHMLIKLSLAQVYRQNQQPQKALNILDKLDQIYPQHSAVQMLKAETLLAAQRPEQAAKTLREITEYAPDNLDAWYLLAEAQGLAGNRNALHIARIEYFLLRGQVATARAQLGFARRERNLKERDLYKLEDLEQQVTVVESYLNSKF
ncbi:MAG: M48 family metallopeptidase [Oceanospirillaceae bacterium]|nr:M48 family metallopeptidase [Oceanospirillaceae bacterium]